MLDQAHLPVAMTLVTLILASSAWTQQDQDTQEEEDTVEEYDKVTWDSSVDNDTQSRIYYLRGLEDDIEGDDVIMTTTAGRIIGKRIPGDVTVGKYHLLYSNGVL